MTRCADLHVHSTASDGRLSPAELVTRALSRGLRVLALTDHDSVDGLDEALRTAQGSPLLVVPGVEFNAQTAHGEAHVLGYCVDHGDTRLRRRLVERQTARDRRAEAMVRLLARLGYPISFGRVQEIAGGGSVGRPHVARALAEAGYVGDVDEAFRRLIRRGAPAYVPTPTLAAPDAVRWVLQAGGIPVLAHPLQVLEGVASLVKEGLAGLEVYYGGYGPEDIAFLERFAISSGLLLTGGSDFHGSGVLNTPDLGDVPLPWEHVERLLQAAGVKAALPDS
ncbi:MAG: PHP domain-containing protein [Anaerolineae bacterium]